MWRAGHGLREVGPGRVLGVVPPALPRRALAQVIHQAGVGHVGWGSAGPVETGQFCCCESPHGVVPGKVGRGQRLRRRRPSRGLLLEELRVERRGLAAAHVMPRRSRQLLYVHTGLME